MIVDLTLSDGFATGLVDVLKNYRRGSVTVVVRGQRGAAALPMHPYWATALRDECAEAGIAFRFAGWGAWVPMARKPKLADRREMFLHSCGMTAMCDGNGFDPWERGHPNWQPMRRVSIKTADTTPLDWRVA